MDKLPTADILNFLIEEISGNEKQHDITHNGYGITMFTRQAIKEVAIEFAKLHVKAALKSSYNNIEYTTVDSSVPYVVEESILNAYPLDNIK